MPLHNKTYELLNSLKEIILSTSTAKVTTNFNTKLKRLEKAKNNTNKSERSRLRGRLCKTC